MLHYQNASRVSSELGKRYALCSVCSFNLRKFIIICYLHFLEAFNFLSVIHISALKEKSNSFIIFFVYSLYIYFTFIILYISLI